MIDTLGDRMKLYESLTLPDRLTPGLPVVIRLDGVSFHTFTKGLNRPYDERLSRLMIDTTKYLVEETNARIGYTQSDEITLILYSDNYKSKIYFDGRIQKILSVLSAKCSLIFNTLLNISIKEKVLQMPVFDCRAFIVPSKIEAVNALIWREKDATKNSISMAASEFYSPTQLHKKNSSEKQEMLFQAGINWNNYPSYFKRGTYVQARHIERVFTVDEIESLPLKHEARINPNLKVIRREIVELDMSILKTENKVEVIFEGQQPNV